MVIVDSSVWIDLLRDRQTPETIIFERLVNQEQLGLGDLILFEVLRGVMPATKYQEAKVQLLRYPLFAFGGQDIALRAIENSRLLRAQGVRVTAIDCLIATFCIISGSRLLSSDHHFWPFEDALGLIMAR